MDESINKYFEKKKKKNDQYTYEERHNHSKPPI